MSRFAHLVLALTLLAGCGKEPVEPPEPPPSGEADSVERPAEPAKRSAKKKPLPAMEPEPPEAGHGHGPAAVKTGDGWLKLDKSMEGFTVEMPAVPESTADPSVTPFGGEVRILKHVAMGPRDSAFIVAHHPLVEQLVDFGDAGKAMDAVANTALAGMGGKLVEQQPFTLAGYQGRDIRGAATLMGVEFSVRVRILFVGYHSYQVMALTRKGDEALAERFFKSFMLTEGAKKMAATGLDLWRRAKSKSGQLSVLLPGDPEHSSESVDTAQGKVSVPTLSLLGKYPPAAYTLSEVPIRAESDDPPEAVLDGWANRLPKPKPTTKLVKLPAKLGDYTGIDVRMEEPGAAVGGRRWGRAYIVDKTLVTMVYVPLTEQATAKEARRFLDSLQLQGKKLTPLTDFSPPGQGFAVSLPGEPEKKTRQLKGGAQETSYKAVSTDLGVIALLSRVAVAKDGTTDDKVLAYSVASTKKGAAGEVQERAVERVGVKGVELKYRSVSKKGNKIDNFVTVFVRDGVLYRLHIGTLGTIDLVEARANAATISDSFRLLR